MKFQIILSTIATVVILSACSQSVHKCSDSLVTKLVTEIADQEIGKALGYTYTVETIRTTNTNEKTGAHECAAELKYINILGGHVSIPITYTVENTDDGESIYVNVFGLR